MKFPRTKSIQFVNNFRLFGKKIGKIWKIEKLREKKVEKRRKKLSDKVGLNYYTNVCGYVLQLIEAIYQMYLLTTKNVPLIV